MTASERNRTNPQYLGIHDALVQDRRLANWSTSRAAESQRHGEAIVPIFIGRGAISFNR